MRRAVLVSLAVALFACGKDTQSAAPDAWHDVDSPDASDPSDGSMDDAGVDAPDADVPDLTAPMLVGVAPAAGGEIWLHEPIRFVFDEPLDIAGVTVSAMIDTASVGATKTLENATTIVVTIDPAARGIGTLTIKLGGTIRDLAGNATMAPIETMHPLSPWHRPAIDRGPAGSSPALAVTTNGSVLAAWTVGPANGQRVVVSRHDGGWQSLGGTLGSAHTTSPAVALDASGRPIVAWIENGNARVERWSNGTWTALPSPGTGSHVVLASPPTGGDPTIAIAGSDMVVRELVADQWQSVSGALPIAGALVGEPALAVTSTRTVVGWIDVAGTPRVRVHRHDTSWTAMAPIVLAAPPAGFDRMSLAARDQTIAVAWDQWGGSFGVYAATATGNATAWTRLGRALDIDVAGDAFAPAIALDAAGAPIVAWRERVETAERGAIARWSSNTWSIIGGKTWLASDTGATTRPTLALHASQSAVVGWSRTSTIGVARFNGPKNPTTGIANRASIAGCSFDPANPPARALQTGCFTLGAPGKPVAHAGLVPYDIVVELWSDGTKKRRWIALPDNTSMTTAGNGSWNAPVGGFVVKEFAIETTPGDPATRRAVETRFFVRTATAWSGFSYRWRLDGSDADLMTDGVSTFDWPLDGGGSYRHLYPSRSHCLSCHHGSQGPLLGLRPQQLTRWYDYSGTIATQIPTLAAISIGPATSATPYIAAHDPSATVAERSRGYMAANCAHCHNPQNIAIKDLRYTTPLSQTRLCEVIVPGSPPQSRLYQLITTRPGMPPLGSLAVDPLATQIVGDWITSMTSCP